jgi:hypothetical protein
MVEATNSFRRHPTSISYVYKVFYHLDMLWMDIGCTLHCYTCVSGVEFFENYGVGDPNWYCGFMVEATDSFRLHPTSISYVYKVF